MLCKAVFEKDLWKMLLTKLYIVLAQKWKFSLAVVAVIAGYLISWISFDEMTASFDQAHFHSASFKLLIFYSVTTLTAQDTNSRVWSCLALQESHGSVVVADPCFRTLWGNITCRRR